MADAKSKTSKFNHFIPYFVQNFRNGYSLHALRKDLLAGITTGIIALPFAIAAATGAGISPAAGIFTAIIGGFFISLFGGSRVQIGGPTSTLIVTLYGLLLHYGVEGMAVGTILAGLILILFGIAGFGAYIKYIPYPVVRGLTTGIAVLIFSSQIKDFFGLDMGVPPVAFVAKWKSYAQSIFLIDPITCAISAATLAIMLFLKRYRPGWPGMIIALVVMTLISWALHLDVETLATRFGALPRTIPSPSLPSFTFQGIFELLPDALSIALIIAIESLLAVVVTESMTGWKSESNCELIATGLANIFSMIFGGLPAAGSTVRTTANIKNGALTPFAGIFHSATIFLILFLLAPLAGKIPLACLAALLILLSWNMAELLSFWQLLKAPKKDILVLLTVFFMTVLVGITAALQVGMILAAFLFMKQMSDLADIISKPNFNEQTENHEGESIVVPAGIEIYDINGPLFFGVADRLKQLLGQMETPPRIFILRMSHVPAIDASGMRALEEFHMACKKRGTVLLLSGIGKKPMKDLKRFSLDERIGSDNIFPHFNLALDQAKSFLEVEPSN